MKRILFPLLCIFSLQAFSQSTGIGTNAPNASAILELSSTTKGFLIPRMSAQQRGLIQNPALGLIVYQNDGTTGLYINRSSIPTTPNWSLISEGSGASLWGTSIANSNNIYNLNPGNVGIGTNAPQAKLHITQTGYGFLQGSSDDAIQIGTYVNNLGGWIGTKSKDNLQFFINNGSPSMTLDTFANLGIGTVVPAYKLSVRANNIGISQETTDGTMKLGFYANTSTGAIVQTHTNHAFNFSTNNGQPQATLATSGNFGIGTTTPSNKLTVKTDNIGFSQESVDGTTRIGFYTSSGTAFLQTHTPQNLNFATNNGGAQMTLTTGGLVGIGTAAPALAKFVVRGTVGATSAVFGDNTSGVSIHNNYPGFGFNSYYNGGNFYLANGAAGYMGFNPNNSRFSFANTAGLGTAGAAALLKDKMWIDFDGTVSLGSADLNAENTAMGSGYKLKVFGKTITEEVRVQVKSSWPDYVFRSDYQLMPLEEVEAFIKTNNHLPGMIKASVVEKEGSDLGETQRRLLEKVEEMTLHMINMNKRLEALEKDNAALRANK